MNGKNTTGGRVLIIESNAAQGSLYADLISTHCPGLRIDRCGTPDCPSLDDNAGGADVALCSCGPTPATRFDDLRRLLSARPCLAILCLIPADQPWLADEAIAAGATDILLRAPGYLQQLPVAIRKNVAISRVTTQRQVRADAVTRDLRLAQVRVCELENELAAISVVTRTAGNARLPLPIITRKRRPSLAA